MSRQHSESQSRLSLSSEIPVTTNYKTFVVRQQLLGLCGPKSKRHVWSKLKISRSQSWTWADTSRPKKVQSALMRAPTWHPGRIRLMTRRTWHLWRIGWMRRRTRHLWRMPLTNRRTSCVICCSTSWIQWIASSEWKRSILRIELLMANSMRLHNYNWFTQAARNCAELVHERPYGPSYAYYWTSAAPRRQKDNLLALLICQLHPRGMSGRLPLESRQYSAALQCLGTISSKTWSLLMSISMWGWFGVGHKSTWRRRLKSF